MIQNQILGLAAFCWILTYWSIYICVCMCVCRTKFKYYWSLKISYNYTRLINLYGSDFNLIQVILIFFFFFLSSFYIFFSILILITRVKLSTSSSTHWIIGKNAWIRIQSNGGFALVSLGWGRGDNVSLYCFCFLFSLSHMKLEGKTNIF